MKKILFAALATVALAACSKSGDSKPQLTPGSGIIGDNKARISSIALGDWIGDCQQNQNSSFQEIITLNGDGSVQDVTNNYGTADCSGQVQSSQTVSGTYTMQVNDNGDGQAAYSLKSDAQGSIVVNAQINVKLTAQTMSVQYVSETVTHDGRTDTVPADQLPKEMAQYHRLANSNVGSGNPVPQPNQPPQVDPNPQANTIQPPPQSSWPTRAQATAANPIVGTWNIACQSVDSSRSVTATALLNADGTLLILEQSYSSANCSGSAVQGQPVAGSYQVSMQDKVNGTLAISLPETDTTPKISMNSTIKLSGNQMVATPTLIDMEKAGQTIPVNPTAIKPQTLNRVK